jgi:WD40 repeat protein
LRYNNTFGLQSSERTKTMRHSILPLLLVLVVTQVARSQETSPGEIATLKLGSRQGASLVAISPDGRLLATAGGDYSDIRIWDVTTARRLHTLKGHSASSAMTFSPDGKLLASAETRSGVLLWDVQSGKQQRKLEVPRDRGWFQQIYCLAFRLDGKTLVAAGSATILPDARMELCTALISWDAGTGKMIEFDKLEKLWTNWLWLSADGGAVACFASTEGQKESVLRVRDLASKKHVDLPSKEINDNNKRAAALSPDGKLAAIGDKLWDVTTGKQLATLGKESFDTISYLSFSPDGKFVAAAGTYNRIPQSSGRNATIGLYKVKTGDVVFAFNAHKGKIYSLAITRNGQTMASVGEDKTVKLWDLDP